MSLVQDYIFSQQDPNQSILQFFHDLISEEPNVVAKIRYKIPFYFRNSWICYLNPVKPEGVELVFLRGNELSNANGLLDSRGRKQVAGVIYKSVEEIQLAPFYETFQEALLLDETVKYKSKRSKQ